MDCRTCQPSLIDLLHGELAMDAAAQAHAHIAQCPSCRGALERLERGLRLARQMPLVDPPQAVSARLLQLAEERARATLAQQRKPRPAPWQALLDFVGRFATGRQVGMVTIMLLIVAVGLWSLPQLRHAPVVAGGTVVNPDESAEAAPSPGVEPARPLDLKVDLRAGRIRPSAETPAMSLEARELESIAAAEPAVEVGRTKGAAEGTLGGGLSAARKAQTGDRLERQGGTEDSLRASRTRVPGRSSGAGPAGAVLQQPEAFPRNEPRARAELRDDPLASLSERAAAPAPTAAAPRKAVESEAKREGASAPSAPAPATAAAPAADRAAPYNVRSELQAARALAQRLGCSAAQPHYERVVQSAPASPEAGEALIDMARCARERGETARAEALLRRAARIPPVATRAAALLAEGDSAESKAKAPAEPAAASEP